MARKNWIIVGATMIGCFLIAKVATKIRTEDENIDDENPYMSDNMIKSVESKIRNSEQRKVRSTENKSIVSYYNPTVYEQKIKPVIDRTLAFGGLVLLAPLYGAISLAIIIDDPGPVFFTQKRVGKEKHFFMLHKFRTMKISAPHDVPTHQLSDPDQYITKVGKFLRKSSLDELPQIWDIFRGKMSIIGPRPALWNQTDLIQSRGLANTVVPGLTGLAQINGRDELEIEIKAELDKEYAKTLRSSSFKGFKLDVCCFFKTLLSVICHDGIVEGGTGVQIGSSIQSKDEQGFPLREGVPEIDPLTDWGYLKSFDIDTNCSVKVLITGAGSYIGTSFEDYVHAKYPNIFCDTLDMRYDSWREYDFSSYDTVFHVAGIAHSNIGKISEKEREKYYKVNTDLAIETARKAKESGVGQFIFMSSMIIYGNIEYINEYTEPRPKNFYGDSKWQADRGIRALGNNSFHVAVLRPPMIYGRGSKGNYPTLEKLAKRLPIFPDVDNCRSMLYIGNLCEFVAKLCLSGESGVYIPQNREYVNTPELVKMIGCFTGNHVHLIKLLYLAVWIGAKIPGRISEVVQKAFGSLYCDQTLSLYEGIDYRKYSLEESLKLTEQYENIMK